MDKSPQESNAIFRFFCHSGFPHKTVHPFWKFSCSSPPTLCKILDTRVQHWLWGKGEGWACVNWKTPLKCKSVPRHLSMIVGVKHLSLKSDQFKISPQYMVVTGWVVKQTLIRWIGTVYISYVYIAPCKGVSLGFWIPCRRFRIPGNGFQLLSVELGQWNSGFLYLYFVFQSPEFLFPQNNVFRIPNPETLTWSDIL